MLYQVTDLKKYTVSAAVCRGLIVLCLAMHCADAYGKVEWRPECLAFAQGRLLWIHPFEDFNGRLTRVLLAKLLQHLDMPALDPHRPTRPEHRTLSASAQGGRSARLGAAGRGLARAVREGG